MPDIPITPITNPTSFLRWRFEDPFDPTLANKYTFALNPNAMTSPFPRRNITAKATTAINGRVLMTEGQRQPVEWTFSGDFLEPNHYEALRSWVLDRVGRRLFLFDHFGRRLTLVPLQFNPTPKRTIGRYYRHTYEITCLVLDITGPTFKVDPPDVPRQLVVTSSQYERASLTWQPPASARGSAVLKYTITDVTQGESQTVNAGDSLSAFWRNRSVGNHTFTVTALSTAGESAAATVTANVTPIVGPFGIQITSASTTYDKATINWSTPADNGGADVTGYQVSAKETSTNSSLGEGTWVVPADTRTFTFTGLASFGNTYDLSVAGINSRATGPAVVKTVKTLVADGPSSPVITDLRATANTVRMEWVVPVRDGGLPLVSYTVIIESFVGGANGDTIRTNIPLSTRSFTFTQLRSGLFYRVSVYAVNSGPLQSAGKTGSNIKTITTQKAS